MKRSVVLAFVILMIVPLARVVSTYRIFSETNDEAFHIGAGLEWLLRGTYGIDPEHPPLARVAIAAPLVLTGTRTVDTADVIVHKLALARAGNLIFLFIALVVVAVWSWRLFGVATSIIATAMFGALPPVLAHAGLATTDCAAMAMTLLALFAFACWLDQPSWRNAAWTGLAIGLGALSKFSFIVFFPVAALMFVLARRQFPRRALQLLPAAIIAALVVWSGYRFTTGTLAESRASMTPDASVQTMAAQYARAPGYEWVTPQIILRYRQYASEAALRGFSGIDFVDWAKAAGYPSPKAGRTGHDTMLGAPPILRPGAGENIRVPAPAFFIGLEMVKRHSASGHTAFLLGRTSSQGWWYYFPVVFFFKTPFAFVILSIAGIAMLVNERHGIALAPLAMLIPAMASGINIGVRHILPIYPFLAMCAAHAAVALWRRAKWLAIVLLSWFFIATSIAHPDYLAYFNECAGRHPENVAVDSNLDWGQDVLRLAQFVQHEHIAHIYVSVFGNWQRFGMPAEALPVDRRVTGWIAVSENQFKFVKGLEWLERERPVRRIGKSIRLYYIPK